MKTNVSYKAQNILQCLLKQNTSRRTNAYKNSGICRTVQTPKTDIGHIGRTFNMRFKEHILAVQNKKPGAWHPKHILDTGNTYGKINTAELINVAKEENF